MIIPGLSGYGTYTSLKNSDPNIAVLLCSRCSIESLASAML